MHFERLDDGILTCPFDHHTRDFAANYLADFDQVCAAAPLVWSTTYGGFWIATSHRVVRRIASDAVNFTVEFGPDGNGGLIIPPPPGAAERPRFVPGEVDGEAHDNYRL